MKKVYLRKNKGITLIALVITIIVLLILAGVAIAMLSGENGILKKAAESKTKTEQAQKEEETRLTDMETTANFLTSNVSYKIKNGYMTGFTVGDMVDKINKELKSLGYEINIKYDMTEKKDIPIEDKTNTPIATGMSVQKDGKTVARTVVFGDIYGDGVINARDQLILKNYISQENYEIKEWQKVAMDINSDGRIDIKDLDLIKLVIRNEFIVDQNRYTYNSNDLIVDRESWEKRQFINNLKQKISDSSIYILENENDTEIYNLKIKTTDSLKVEDVLGILPDGGEIKRNGEEVATTEDIKNGDEIIYKYKEEKDLYIGKIIIE